MALTTTANRVGFSGNGVTTVWPFTFPIPDATYLSVIYTDATGVDSTISVSAYSVSGIGTTTGGNVTYPLVGSPIAASTKLTLVRTVPYTQTTVLSNQGGYYPEVLEARLDLITMEAQQLADLAARSLVVPASDSITLSQLPTATTRAGKVLAFDSTGQPIAQQSFGTWRGTWATAISYNLNDIIQDGAAGANTNNIYIAQIIHTSGTWATDLASAKWVLAIDVATFTAAAAASATAAAASATAASTSAAAASTSAGNALTSQAAALASASAAATSATTSSTQAAISTTQANAAAASALAAAAYAAALTATSTTSLLIAVASRTFTTQTGKQFAAGQFISAVSAANNANFMHGQVTSYSATTLVVNVTDIGGSGTLGDWNLSISGSQGSAGVSGPGVPVATATGSVNAITATYSPVLTLTDLTLCALVSIGANTSTTPTFSPDGLTARTITARGGSSLAPGDIGAAGAVVMLEYNLANTRWELLNPSLSIAANGMFVNSQTVAADYTVASGYNALSAGPITINGGVTVTVTSGSNWAVV